MFSKRTKIKTTKSTVFVTSTAFNTLTINLLRHQYAKKPKKTTKMKSTRLDRKEQKKKTVKMAKLI